MVDTGASHIFCNRASMMRQLRRQRTAIELGDLSIINAEQVGAIVLYGVEFPAIYVPQFHVNLLSVSVVTKIAGWKATFTENDCVFLDDNVVLRRGTKKQGLYVLTTGSALVTTRLQEKNMKKKTESSGSLTEEYTSENDKEMEEMETAPTFSPKDDARNLFNYEKTYEMWH